jgi:hypothetical protein
LSIAYIQGFRICLGSDPSKFACTILKVGSFVTVDSKSVGTASLPKSSFDSLPFDMGYETSDQFPGRNGVQQHEVFNHKELCYPIWVALEKERDPEGRLGRSLTPVAFGDDHISTILNRYAWTYCIERTNKMILEKLKLYKGYDTVCWGCLIEKFRVDWTSTKATIPGWWGNILMALGFRKRANSIY